MNPSLMNQVTSHTETICFLEESVKDFMEEFTESYFPEDL